MHRATKVTDGNSLNESLNLKTNQVGNPFFFFFFGIEDDRYTQWDHLVPLTVFALPLPVKSRIKTLEKYAMFFQRSHNAFIDIAFVSSRNFLTDFILVRNIFVF